MHSLNQAHRANTDISCLDRHWTDREFPELADKTKEQKCLEVGCGVGNFVFPLLADNPSLFIYACDFSKRAVEMVKGNESYNESRCKAFVCDLTADKLTDNIPENSLDLVIGTIKKLITIATKILTYRLFFLGICHFRIFSHSSRENEYRNQKCI